MRSSRLTAHRCALASAFAVMLMALSAEGAAAGEFSVANCQADPLNHSTRAFDEFATRGMKIRRACDPEGPGLRGLITSNVVRGGRVGRGAVAMVTISAPLGTRFTSFRWAGTARRRDCRYALQLYAEAPDIQPIAIKNVRANQCCPRPRRAQAAGYRSRTFNVTGTTRIVQRVICVGGAGRRSCSARASNYLRTYEAEVSIADVVAPAAAIIGDTPLARGEWVHGTQPLNYDASDNVGVRLAHAISSSKTGGFEQRPCAFASPERSYAERVPCPNVAGILDCPGDKLDRELDALAARSRTTVCKLRVDGALRERARCGRYAYVHERGADFAAGIWVIDPVFMLDAIRAQLEAGEDTVAREQSYFAGAGLHDPDLRAAGEQDRAQRADARARQIEATRSNLGLGHDLRAGLLDPSEAQLQALKAIVCHLLARHQRELIAYGAGWSNRDRQQPVGDSGRHEPRQIDAITDAELERALADPDPLRAIAGLVASWSAAFVLDPDGVTRTKALGSERMARKLRDALPGGQHPLRAAVWEFLRPMLSPRLVELHRDAFVIDDGPESTVDLAAHRGDSSLEHLDLGEHDSEGA